MQAGNLVLAQSWCVVFRAGVTGHTHLSSACYSYNCRSQLLWSLLVAKFQRSHSNKRVKTVPPS